MASTIQTSGELKARMSSLEKSLGGVARSASFGASAMTVLFILSIASAAFFFYYWRNEVKQIVGLVNDKSASTFILDAIENQLNEKLDPARKSLEGVVKENAPALAEFASTSVVEGMPAFREHAVTMAIAGMDQSLAESNKHAQDMVAAYLHKNEAKIKDAVKRLSGSPNEADEFLKDLNEAFTKEVEVDVDVAVKQVSEFIDGFNGLLTKTKSDSVRLTHLQAMQREILMLFKRAMMDHTVGAPVAQR